MYGHSSIRPRGGAAVRTDGGPEGWWSVEFRLLGPVEIHHAGCRWDLGGPRERALLALLLLEAGTPVPRDRLIALLWDDERLTNPRVALQTAMSRLRSRLARNGPDPPRLVTSDGGYLADVDPQAVDVHRFRTLVQAARTTAEPAERAAGLRAALAMWRGPILADAGSARLRERIGAELTELRLVATELAVDAELACGRHRELVGELVALTTEHPFRERLTGQLMLALYRSDRHPEALDAYARLRDQLADQLGIDPGPELRRLHTAVLRLDPALTGDVAPRHTYLPAANIDFTGRDSEVDRLVAAAEQATVLAIDGMGGIGKTTLALHVAHRLATRYRDGQFFLDLRGHTAGHRPTEPAVALGTLLRAVGVPGDKLPAGLDERAARWRAETAGRRILLLVDNAAAAAQVRPLLPGSPTALTVVTSRRHMSGLDNAWTLSLDALPHHDAVTLFARAVADTRATAEPTAAADIVTMCGHLPLAIRLAGARLRHRPTWTVHYLADRLRDERCRLDELRAEDSGVAAAFALSYDQLGEAHQRIFRRLSLAPGPHADRYATAASANASLDEVDRILEDLVDANLVQATASGRYALHDLVRQFAHQRMESELERIEAANRFLDYYLSVTDAAARIVDPHSAPMVSMVEYAPKYMPVLAERTANDWLEAERATLGAAVRQALDDGRLTVAWQLAATLFRFHFAGGHFDELIRAHEAGLEATVRLRDRQAEATIASRLGIAHHHYGRYDTALRLYERARRLRSELGLREAVANTYVNIALVHERLRRYAEATDHLQHALAVFREVGNRQMEGTALSNLGCVLERLGRYDEALDHQRRALTIAREHGDGWNEAIRLANAGRALSAAGRHEEALADLEQALTLIRTNGDRSFEAQILYDLGVAQRAAGLPALDTVRHALAMTRRTANRYTEARALCVIAELDPTAETARDEALMIFSELGLPEADEMRLRHARPT
jgi:DNA-binding SARP family transcriptional activator/tetratricopeptide (TPR) repeat protein